MIPIRVLVVEDDAPTRAMLVQFLTDEGFHVIAAHDGEHALRLARAGRPDVIVLDMGLPILDATGFVDRWRARGSTLVPIIAMSGLPHGHSLADQISAVAFYRKPFDLQTLAGTARAVARPRT